MDERQYIKNKQRIVAIASLITFLLLLFLIIKSIDQQWKSVQREYFHLNKNLSDSLEIQYSKNKNYGIHELNLSQLNRKDRCISCHNGIENPLMEDAPQPHTQHPGSFLENHPISDFGCTICHGGQGRAMNKKDAFGLTAETHWPYPLLYQPYIQSSCGKCHLTIFNTGNKLEGTEIFDQGRDIFATEGCLGCHKARGLGGIIGPDLTQQGEKTKHEYSFLNIEDEQTISNWLKTHFMDPEMVSPGSKMLKIDLPEEELQALATFVMGLSMPDIPLNYFSSGMLQELKGVRDTLTPQSLFSFTCSSCHGKAGEGKSYTTYQTGVPELLNQDFLRIASEEFIFFSTLKGRSKKEMASWSYSNSGFFWNEIFKLSKYLKSFNKNDLKTKEVNSRHGHSMEGKAIYENHCLTCHGIDGKGGLAISLKQPDFLSRASDQFIAETLTSGRGNTAMPSWPELNLTQIEDILSYLRSWPNSEYRQISFHLQESDLNKGELLFHFNCSRCHGSHGEGETGPAIINQDLLQAASDGFLLKTVAEGRSHTSMFGWSKDVFNKERMNETDISNVIAYMRKEASILPKYIYAGSNPGNSTIGKNQYLKNCSECHGYSGEGITAPALNNQEFLSGASNGYILGTMTLGRNGTRMPSWGYERNVYTILNAKERQDIAAFIRTWQRIRIGF